VIYALAVNNHIEMNKVQLEKKKIRTHANEQIEEMLGHCILGIYI
jgi:hypothetical protein